MFFKSLFKSQPVTNPAQNETLKIKVAVAAFEDDCPENSGKLLAQCLSGKDFLDVTYYESPADNVFANLNSRNFFDFPKFPQLFLQDLRN